MKLPTLFAAGLACCSLAHAQFQFKLGPSEAQASGTSEETVRAMGQVLMHTALASQKAEFTALAAHCARLEKQYAAGYAARRPELEQQWQSYQQRQDAVIDIMGMLMSSRGGVSMPDLMNKVYRAMPPNAASVPSSEPLPEVPAAIQESANRKAMDEVKRRMDGLSWERQRELCNAGMVSGALPKEPEKETAQGKDAPQGM